MKKIVLSSILLTSALFAFAGDLAVLANLGFGGNGRYFMFGQHVLIPEAGQAYAEIAVVDVPRNVFVPGGWKKHGENIRMLPNQDSRGALYDLLADSVELKKRYGIRSMQQGRLLYTRADGDDTMVEKTNGSEKTPSLFFRDFEESREYEMNLNQTLRTAEASQEAAFDIDFTIRDSAGTESSYTVGRAGYFRPGIVSYKIARVWIAPNNKSLIIAVAKEDENFSIRYMVETVSLK